MCLLVGIFILHTEEEPDTRGLHYARLEEYFDKPIIYPRVNNDTVLSDNQSLPEEETKDASALASVPHDAVSSSSEIENLKAECRMLIEYVV